MKKLRSGPILLSTSVYVTRHRRRRLLPVVQDRRPLGDALLSLLGVRLKLHLTRTGSDALEKVEKYSLISTKTVEWLRSLPETIVNEEQLLNCDNLKKLARQTERYLMSAG
jgi:hypothetical protein